ncbi:Hexose transporter 2 [Vanrija pseudolonga]|uniref:Hexose transporter 2 n=1 Tax=Vanrija pseudolonga TaxID=143232 RepID=A0AAF0YKW5_9TREE|nr:Hexose transporter 2 [Vanrija pseudolonga]
MSQVTPADEKANTAHVESVATPREDDGVIIQKATQYHDAQLKSDHDMLGTWDAVKKFRRVTLICAIAGFAAATDGYQHQMVASIVANKGFIRQFAAAGQAKINPSWVSSFGGIYSAGQVIGQFSIQFVADGFGRKMAMYTFIVGLIIAAIVECVSTVWWHWTIAKLIGGIAVGSVQATLPVYINELAPAQIRGFLVVTYSMWFSFGTLCASLALKARADTNPMDWKTMIYSQFGMIGLGFLLVVFLPESPWWLVRKGKVERARAMLEKNFKGVAGYDVDAEVSIIAATIKVQHQWDVAAKAEGPFAMLQGLNLKRFLIGSWPKVLQQFVGLAIFGSYSAYFFQLAGNKDPFLVTVIMGCLSIAAVFIDSLLVDKIGRRRMTLIGFTGACTGMVLMAIVGCLDYARPSLGALLVFAGCLANFFNTFQSSTSYAYLTEMPELRFKARATGWGLAYCNLYAILINFTVPLMIQAWKVKSAFFFVCLGIPGTVVAYFIMPESMGRSPAEIQEMFVDRVPLRKWKGYKTDVEKDLEARMGQGEE